MTRKRRKTRSRQAKARSVTKLMVARLKRLRYLQWLSDSSSSSFQAGGRPKPSGILHPSVWPRRFGVEQATDWRVPLAPGRWRAVTYSRVAMLYDGGDWAMFRGDLVRVTKDGRIEKCEGDKCDVGMTLSPEV